MNKFRQTARAIRTPAANQRGVALFISLVLLLVLTIIGVSAVQTTSLEVRMARNDYDSLLAFQAAESALRDAEADIEEVLNLGIFTATGVGGLWDIPDLDDAPRWELVNVWAGANTIVGDTVVDGVSAQPRYMIEHVASVQRVDSIETGDLYGNSGSVPDRIEMFRVTALGFGGTQQANVMLQSTYGRILD